MADTNTPPSLGPMAGKTFGKSGTVITSGIISLEEYNRKLVGKSALEQYDIMRRSDSTIRAVLQVVKLPLFAANWDIQAAQIDDEDPDHDTKQDLADYKARFVKRELFDRNVNFDELLKSLCTGLEFGFNVEEKTYDTTEFEGQLRIGIAKIDKRKQTTIISWTIQDNVTPGITQALIGDTAYIPMEKLIVFTHDKEGENYEGISLLRYVYKDWDIKDKLTIVNAIALEKLGVGVPLIEEKPGITANNTDKEKAREALRNFRANEQAYLEAPASLAISFLDLKANTTKDVIPTLNYHDRRVSQSILAQFMDLGGKSGGGSHALGKDLTSLFLKSEEGLGKLLISCLQEQLIKQLCDFNFTDMSEGYPTITVSNIADDDVTTLATSLSSLVTAGAVTPDADLEDHLREMMSLPPLPQEIRDDYQALRPAKPAAPGDPTETPPPTEVPKDEDGNDLLPDAETKAAIHAARQVRKRLIDIVKT